MEIAVREVHSLARLNQVDNTNWVSNRKDTGDAKAESVIKGLPVEGKFKLVQSFFYKKNYVANFNIGKNKPAAQAAGAGF